MQILSFFRRSPRGALGTVLLTTAAAWLSLGVLSQVAYQWRSQPAVQGSYIEGGEGLLLAFHPIETQVSYHLPLGSVLFALQAEHSQGLVRRLLNVFPMPTMVLVLVGIGMMMGSGLAAVASAALYLALEAGTQGLLPYFLYALLVVLVGAVLVWRADSPSLGRSAVLAVAIGVSLLFRSPLAFFPPFLILYEAYFRKDPRLRPYWPHGLMLAVVPYLLLLPWLRLNWVVLHRLVLFEDGQADCNIITGALGIVSCVVGDWQTLMPSAVDRSRPFPVLWWAVHEIARHPFRYAYSYVARVAYVASFHPWLCLLAVAGLLLGRSRLQARYLALLAAYFVGIHCFMSLKDDYMRPVWPLLTPLAALLIDEFLRCPPPSPKTVAYKTASAGLLALIAIEAGFGIYVLGAVVRYTALFRERSPQSDLAMRQAFERAPDDPWLRRRRAELRLEQGDARDAALDLSHALERQTEEPELRLDLGWTVYLMGSSRYLLNDCPYPYPQTDEDMRPMDTPVPPYIKPYFYKALALHASGRESEAQAQLDSAWRDVDGYQTMHRVETERERVEIERMRSKDGFVVLNVLERQFWYRPPAERAYLLGALLKRAPKDAGLWLGAGEVALQLGDRRGAWADYQRALALPLDAQGRQMARSFRDKLGPGAG